METYYGHVRSPADAIILFEACRLGLLPRVQRRLSEKERQSIRSGSVFVWDEREAGMRRWTDGKSWSASRVSGSFLTYREMEGKRGNTGYTMPAGPQSRPGKTPESNRNSDEDADQNDEVDGYRYKPDGLMKQSFSISTANHQKLHLISYYSRSHPAAASLPRPTGDPNLKHVRPAKGMYPESTTHETQTMPMMVHGGPMDRGYGLSPGHSPASTFASPYGRPPYPPPPPGSYQQPPYARHSPKHAPTALYGPPPTTITPPYASIHGETYPPLDSYRAGPYHHGPPSPHHYPPPPGSTGNAPTIPSPLSSGAQPAGSIGAYSHPSPPNHHNSKWEIHPQMPPLRDPPSNSNSANSIPSVGALVNGAKDSPLAANSSVSKIDPKMDASSSVPTPQSTSRPGSKSPDTAKAGLDVQDIPGERMKFVEDARAVNILNKAFVL